VLSDCLEIEETVVLRWRVAEEALSIEAKMRQLPPLMAMAPLVAMQTMVSRPWM
jgi:hypothetical protein